MVFTLVVHGRVHTGHRYHCLHGSEQDQGMGIVCIFKGFADPMYAVPNYESVMLYTKAYGGNIYEDPDNGSAKYVHVQTRPDDTQVRMDRTQTTRWGMDSPRLTTYGPYVNPPRVTHLTDFGDGPSPILVEVPDCNDPPASPPQLQRSVGGPRNAAA
eukprot:9909861-Lingulodinium_polyedra.AAC.1